MRIPAELLSLFPGGIGNKAFSPPPGAAPVHASPTFDSTLPDTFPKQGPALRKSDATIDEETADLDQGENRRNKGIPPGTEEHRRKETRPVLLDTRLRQSRRKSDLRSAIDVEI